MALGYLWAFLALVFWGLNMVVARYLAPDVPPAALSFWRWSIAAVLIAWLVPRVWRQRAAVRAHWQYYVQLGLTGVAVFHVLIYIAAHTTNGYSILLIASTSGVFVKLFTLFTNQRLSPAQGLGAVLAVLGLGILLCRGELEALWQLELVAGDLWMLLAAAIWAYYSMLVEHRPRGEPFDNHVVAILVGLPLLGFMYGVELAAVGPFELSWQLALILLYLGVFPSLVSYWLWISSVERIGAVRAHGMYYLLPLVGSVQAWLLLDEKLGWYHLFAAAAILAGAILTHQRQQSPGAPQAS